ncbi:MAG: hypothetical protein CFE24_05330 [Flavobacterium sp. BFFFF2]|nr:MAG: hypothetical protein CFE24_05330 [Flavobacterium sp. BFFFF2]
MCLYYCNDSLNIYTQFFGDFNQNEFLKNPLFKGDKYILSKTCYVKKQDLILFHSFTTMEPIYNVLGVLRAKVDLSSYSINLNANAPTYYKTYFGKYNAYEVLYPVQNKTLSIIFYERNIANENILKNIVDYERMRDMTFESLKNKYCGKEDIIKAANEYFNVDSKGNYLAYKKIKKDELNYTNTTEESIYRQILSTYLSFAQENAAAEQEFNKLQKNKITTDNKKNFNSTEIETQTLIDSIKSQQLVIFNEAHHIPRHRYLVGTILNTLYNAGFRYFGLEAFSDDEKLTNIGFPTLSNGFYFREQTMGNLIREAKRIGFTVFEFDSQNNNREYEQAEKIYNKTFKNDVNAKVLILSGYSHIDEKDGWMADQFHLKFNMNPYTINQTAYYYYDLESIDQLEFVEPEKINFKNDLFVNNNIQIKNNCFGLRDSKEIGFNFPAYNSDNNVLLVYNKNEFEAVEDPIPVFVKSIEKNQSYLKINLCFGNYITQIKSIQGLIKFEQIITVE